MKEPRIASWALYLDAAGVAFYVFGPHHPLAVWGKEVLILALFADDYHVLTKDSPTAELVKQVTLEF